MKIRDLFISYRHTFSFEFSAPKNAEMAEELFATAEALKLLGPSFISVTYGAGGSTRRNTIDVTCRFQEELGMVAMTHLTCVGHSQAELRVILQELKSRGVENLMLLRGDPPRGQTDFTPAPDGFTHAYQLVLLARSLGDFCIGVAGYPEGHPECPSKERDLEYLRYKVDCGADFVITQLYYDNRDYFDFVERAARIGIKVRIIPGIMPITNYRQIMRIAQLCGASIPAELKRRLASVSEDPQAILEVGVDWAWQQCEELLANGAPGIHFYTMNRSLATQRIFVQLRQTSVGAMLLPA